MHIDSSNRSFSTITRIINNAKINGLTVMINETEENETDSWSILDIIRRAVHI